MKNLINKFNNISSIIKKTHVDLKNQMQIINKLTLEYKNNYEMIIKLQNKYHKNISEVNFKRSSGDILKIQIYEKFLDNIRDNMYKLYLKSNDIQNQKNKEFLKLEMYHKRLKYIIKIKNDCKLQIKYLLNKKQNEEIEDRNIWRLCKKTNIS